MLIIALVYFFTVVHKYLFRLEDLSCVCPFNSPLEVKGVLMSSFYQSLLITLGVLCCKYINKANFIRNIKNKNIIGCFAMFHAIHLGGKKYMGIYKKN